MLTKARVTAVGGYVPERKLTNQDLEKMIDTSDEWITQRTGIKVRHIAAEDEFTSDIATKAVENLAAENDVSIDDVDFVILATFTPDFYTPSSAALVQANLGLPKTTGVLDINAACAGFAHGLIMANAYISAGIAKKIIVIGAEVISKTVDYEDRNTCILFGDGAAAFLVEGVEESEEGHFLASHFGSDGANGTKLFFTGLAESNKGEPLQPVKKLWQDGRAVYKFAIKTVPKGMQKLLETGGMSISQVDWFVPHSANMRMLQFICKELDFSIDKTLVSAEEFGNTSAASIPLAVWRGVQTGKVKKGDTLAMYGFGGGLNHAGLVLRW